MKKDTKFIFFTGGVYSSLGKGTTASSLGRILKELGYSVMMQKLDPYLNINPSFISPLQHGEVFITCDGWQCDLDLGNYERFTGINLNNYCSLTSGRIYSEVLEKERKNEYDGKTIQVIPHITNHIIEKFKKLVNVSKADFIIVEIGGTVGDIESIPFFETISSFAYQYGKENVMFTHCVPLIELKGVGELKTKPAQHSVRTLRGLGISPDMLILRSSCQVDEETKTKLSAFCMIEKGHIFVAPDLQSTYFLPEVLFEQEIYKCIFKYFNLRKNKPNIDNWLKFTNTIKTKKTNKLNIAIVGEYVDLHDSYFSVVEALKLSAYALNVDLKINWVHSKNLTPKNIENIASENDGFVFAGGLDNSYQEKYNAFLKYVEENNLVVLTYFLGFNPFVNYYSNNKVDFVNLTKTMLGSRTSQIQDKLLNNLYNSNELNERHNHDYELKISDANTLKNLDIVAVYKDYVDGLKLKNNTFNYAFNFNPEFTARPIAGHPIFNGFFKTALEKQK